MYAPASQNPFIFRFEKACVAPLDHSYDNSDICPLLLLHCYTMTALRVTIGLTLLFTLLVKATHRCMVLYQYRKILWV